MAGEVDWLPAKTLERVRAAVAALEATFGDGFHAAALVGAAASPVREDRAREPEVLAVVAEVSVESLTRLAESAGSAMRSGVHVRVLSEDDLARSADVFALEIAEWRDRHVLLAGTDPFTKLQIDPGDLRRSLEAALRGLGRRIRNRSLAAWATQGKRDDARRAVVDGLNRLVSISHHALALAGDSPPADEPALLRGLGKHSGADVAMLLEELAAIRKTGQPADPKRALEALLSTVENATGWMDALEAQ